MRNYIILNDINSNTINGLLIQELPPISKPKMRTQIEEIDGRAGDIITQLGFSAYDKTIEIGLYGNFDINEVISYFNSEGTVIFSNEPDKYYNYQIIEQIDFERLIRFRTAKVKMHVQPFKYPVEEEPLVGEYQYVSDTGSNLSLNNTANALFKKFDLKGNTSQTGTPTPSSPIPVNVVSGDNEIVVCGKNLFDKSKVVTGYLIENGTIYDTLNYNTSDYIIVEPNTSYYKTATSSPRTKYYDKNKQPLNTTTYQDISIGGNEGTFTTPNNAYYLRFSYPTSTVDANSIMLHKGISATTYEPYIGNTYNIDLPVENLWGGFTNSFSRSHNGVDFTVNTDGTITANGTSTDWAISMILSEATSNGIYKSLPKGTYTVSGGGSKYTVEIYNKDTSTRLAWINNTEKSTSFTINETVNIVLRIQVIPNVTINETIKLMLCKGSKANSFTPYGTTPIELCKIGNYQDYIYKDSDKWYLHKEIGKELINVSVASAWAFINNCFQSNSATPSDIVDISSSISALSNNFKYVYWATAITSNLQNGEFGWNSSKKLTFKIDGMTSKQNYIDWFTSNTTYVYYQLATPTNTEITYQPLIDQLNAIKLATSKQGQTNIIHNSNDLPFLLDVSALQSGSDQLTVTNEGNIYSRPTIDLEGTGIVDIYLEGNQMFQVDLTDTNEIVIDTDEMEAYNPSNQALMNRQVTGNYDNFKINAGDNTLKFSGDLTKATVTNYVRWL